MNHDANKQALAILFNTYWTSAGWKPERTQMTSPEDFAFAKKQGVMFDPLELDHANVMSRLKGAVQRLTPESAGNAFLTSLTTRRLDWRSAFGSHAVFRHLTEHPAVGSKQCSWCGLYVTGTQDLNVLNFERHKWGGVRHCDPVYAMLDLELFALEPLPIPSEADVAIFEAVVAAIEQAPSDATSANLHKVFPSVLKGNKAERDVIVAMLGFCGALASKRHPGFSERFIPTNARPLPDRRFVDMAYPACWWTRAEGFDRSALKPYFGHVSNAV